MSLLRETSPKLVMITSRTNMTDFSSSSGTTLVDHQFNIFAIFSDGYHPYLHRKIRNSWASSPSHPTPKRRHAI